MSLILERISTEKSSLLLLCILMQSALNLIHVVFCGNPTYQNPDTALSYSKDTYLTEL